MPIPLEKCPLCGLAATPVHSDLSYTHDGILAVTVDYSCTRSGHVVKFPKTYAL